MSTQTQTRQTTVSLTHDGHHYTAELDRLTNSVIILENNLAELHGSRWVGPAKWDGSRIECAAVLGASPEGSDPTDGAAGQEEAQDASDDVYGALEDALVAALEDAGELPIEVLGLGEDWTPVVADAEGGTDEELEADEGRIREQREYERYGVVRVQVADVTYDVGVALGVPESMRGTARAAGGAHRPYVSSWIVDRSDWVHAPASDGSRGVPRHLVDAVYGAISAAAWRLWSEA